jgi:hypothetical protein
MKLRIMNNVNGHYADCRSAGSDVFNCYAGCRYTEYRDACISAVMPSAVAPF